MKLFSSCIFLFASVIGTSLSADIRLPKIFSDNMVLQRDTNINVWGWSKPGEELTITLGEQTAQVTADDAGNWAAQVKSPDAGGPYELTVAGSEAQVVFKNVLIGEVWICSGESNMQCSLSDSIPYADETAKEAFLAAVNDQRIRLYTVPRITLDQPATDFSEASLWQECTPETVRDFSGLAYFFAKHLRESEKLADMPIGLINCSIFGVATCESWTSREALAAEECFKPLLAHWDENSDDRGPNRPASLFNGMVAPLAPMSVRGVVWYQGESNVGRGRQYADLFPTMIKDWRRSFEQGDIPFYFVQLAPFRYSENSPQALPEVWDAQVKSLNVPNTGMVVTVDIGDPENIHPKNKEQVGHRLAQLARWHTHGEIELNCFGPMFSGVEYDSGKATISFQHAEGLRSAESHITGFAICGKDQKFVPANAKIEDGKVIVWSDEIQEPTQVRYLWDDSASASLFNKAGLPASPFRTDQFELLSKDRHF